MGSCTDSNYACQYKLNGTFAPTANYKLLSTFVNTCEKNSVTAHVGNVLTSDTFYNADESSSLKWKAMGVLAVEMESAALYMNAAAANKNALAVFTISDCPFKKTEISSEERQNSFDTMMRMALETAVCL